MLKRIAKVLCLLVAFMLLLPQTIAAKQTQREVILDVNDNKVDIYLDMSDLSSITSLQLSLKVTSEKGVLDTKNFMFDFEDAIENKIQKWTYQPQTGMLNIYLADNEVTTLSSQTKLHLGTLSVNASNLEDISVSVLEDGLQLVNKSGELNTAEKVASSSISLGKDDIENSGDNSQNNGDTSQGGEDNTQNNEDEQGNTEEDTSKEEETGQNEENNSSLPQGEKEESNIDNSNNVNVESSKKDKEKETIKTGQTAPVVLYAAGMLGALTLGAIIVILKKKQDLLHR